MSKNDKGGSMSKVDVYEEVTNRIVESLEQGVIPWQKPWKTSGIAGINRNIASGKAYGGINQMLLGMASYDTPLWGTYKQFRELAYRQWLKKHGLKDSQDSNKAFVKAEDSGSVAKGEKSTMIIFFKPLKVKDKDTGKDKTIPLLRYYNVFNAEQTQGIDYTKPALEEISDWPMYNHLPEHKRGSNKNPAMEAKAMFFDMPNRPTVEHHGESAYYQPAEDKVVLPVEDKFFSEEAYLTTAFHELVHSTGHKDRLNRAELAKMNAFGDSEYSKEELTAEMGAAMLCAQAGINGTFDNSAAYIKNWISKLKDDKKFIVSAAAKAQKAVEYINPQEA